MKKLIAGLMVGALVGVANTWAGETCCGAKAPEQAGSCAEKAPTACCAQTTAQASTQDKGKTCSLKKGAKSDTAKQVRRNHKAGLKGASLLAQL